MGALCPRLPYGSSKLSQFLSYGAMEVTTTTMPELPAPPQSPVPQGEQEARHEPLYCRGASIPKTPCSLTVYKLALKRLPYHNFGVCVYTRMLPRSLREN